MESYFLGIESPADNTALETWCHLHPDHEQEFKQLMQLWSASGEVLAQPEFDTSKAWQVMESRLSKRTGRGTRIPLFGRMAIAAAVLAAFVLAGGRVFTGRISREGTAGWRSVVAADGNKLTILPDGSTVTLRKGATLQYPPDFNDRKVSLAGEAYFDIHPEKGRPFRIATARLAIEVLGTSFLVNASPLADRVVVTTGRVLLRDKHRSERYCILLEKQEALFSEKELEKKPVTAGNFLSWQTGDLKFVQTPLDQVAADLSDHYGVLVRLADTLVPKADRYKVTSEFTTQSLAQSLEEIMFLTGLRYKKEADTIIIYHPN